MRRRVLKIGIPIVVTAAVLAAGGRTAWYYLSFSPARHIHLLGWRSCTVYWEGHEMAAITSRHDLSRLRHAIDWYHPDPMDGMASRCGDGDRFYARVVDLCGRKVDLELPVDDCLHVNVLHGDYGFYAPRFLQTLGTLITDESLQQKTWLSPMERDQLLDLVATWRRG